MEMSKLPLEGIRVIDLTVVFAGPFATWLLGCLGAEVIRVDSIHHQPDLGRVFVLWPTEEMLEGTDGARYPDADPGKSPWNRCSFFNRISWNKLSCCINLKDQKGKNVFKRLIKKSDVFIENNSAVAMEHLGLGPEELLKVNPGLISINMPSYGRSGPYKDYVGWGENAETLTGHHWVRGYPDGDHPIDNTAMFHMDSTGGTIAAIAAIMALRQRKMTGKGRAIDFGQIESFMPQLGEIYMDYAWNGRVQRTDGNRHPKYIQGTYPCRGDDAWVNITVHDDEEWAGLGKAMGKPDWMKDEKFSTREGRRKCHDEIDAKIEEWTKIRDKDTAFHILQSHGVPAGPVQYESDTYHDPHLLARNFFKVIHQEDTGTYRYPGFLWNMSKTPPRVKNPPCRMGEHNDYVFREVIGMSEEEISELSEDKIIGGNRYEWA
jgi:crotonobetainyl-CoA:carnitine CoA-transferase CaiB-like acyl-CoA transferase